MGFRLRFGEFRIERRVVLDAVAVVGLMVVVGSVGLGVVVVVLIVVFAVVTTLALGRSR